MANDSNVKLLGAWASPFVLRPRIALNIKCVEYEMLQETFGAKSELLIKSNPIHKKIPVLIHNDKPVCESLVIVQYIDEAWSSPSATSILPSDPYDRAIARFWAAYIDDKWTPLLGSLPRLRGEERASTLEKVGEGLDVLEGAFTQCSKGKSFFGGDSIGLVDIALGSFLGWLRVAEIANSIKLIDATTRPQLAGWAERFCADSSVKDVMPATEKLLEFVKVIQAALRAPPPSQ